MIRINLMPRQEIALASRGKREIVAAGVTMAFLVAFLGVAYLDGARKVSGLRQTIATEEAKTAGIGDLKRDNVRLSEIKKDLLHRLETIQELEEKSGGPWKVLDELSRRVPDKLWLTEIHDTGGKATLTGLALDHASIASFLMNLSRSPKFNNVDLIEVVEEEKNGRPLKRFSTKAEFRY